MKKVIDIADRLKKKADPELQEMLRFSDGIDRLITEHVSMGIVDTWSLVAVLSHRLGHFISVLPCDNNTRDLLLNHSLELILKLSAEGEKQI